MADLSKTIQIVFEGLDKTGSAITGVGKGIEDLASGVQNATQPLADITKSILAFDAAVVGLAAVLGSKAVAETAKFEESLYLVQKQLGDTGPSMEKAKADIEAVALAYGTNANTVAESTASFLAAGYDYETAAKLVDSSTQLMIAGELDAATATNAITASLAGFKVPAGEAAEASVKIGDVLNKIGDISSGAFTEIVDGFKTIAPTAKDAGLSMEQTAAAIATIVDTGYSGSEAATALKSGLVQLVKPPGDAREALEALGVELTDSNGKQKLAGEIMAELAGKYAGLTEEQKLQTAAVIFGKDQAGKLNALLGDWGKSQDYVAQMLDKTTGATGSMAKEVEGKLGLLTTAINRADEAWRQALESFGAQINAEGSVNAFYNALTNLGVALKNAINTGGLDPLVEAYQGAYETLAEITDNIAKNLPEALAKIDWSKFQAAIGELSGSFDNLFSDIDLSTPEGLAEVIQTIIDVGANLINITSGIVDGLSPLFDIIVGLIKGFSELDPEIAGTIGVLLGLGTTVNTVAGVFGSIGSAISGTGGIISAFGKLNPALQAIGVAFAAFELGKQIAEWTGLGKAIEDGLNAWKGIPEVVGPAEEAVGRADDKLAQVAKTLGVSSLSMEEFNAAVDSGELKFNDLTSQWEKAGESGEKLISTEEAVAAGMEAVAAITGKSVAELSKKEEATYSLADASATLGLAEGEVAIAIKDANGQIIGYEKGLANASAASEEAAKSAKELASESEKFALEWEKLLSAERTAIFEAQADIQVAQIEADSKRAVAAMEMLSSSFQNTGDVLTELIGLWAGLEGMDQQQITEWIEREYEIREQLAQAQIDLVQAEIARMEAQTRLLERGGVELTIQSDGLEPELEAFMFKIIDRVRVAVAGSYEEFLLGCGA